MQSLNSAASGTRSYGYSAIGNVLTNLDFGSGRYQYGARPHAVTNANGVSYGYDACGNVTSRGSQNLTYNEQNELVQVSGPGLLVRFGYDASGERLWRSGTNGYSLWIGGLYEINNGKVLCHVLANGTLVATFEPHCGGPWVKVIGEDRWYAALGAIDRTLNWPLQKGRGPWMLLAGLWAAVIVLCVMAGSRIELKRREIRRALRPAALWRQAVAFVSITAFLWAGIGNVEAATYNPVFYYYHCDHLGSSKVLTDRSGNLVQHYEYTAFGQTGYSANTAAYPVSNRYTGQIADDETGLYYYGARYYDPQLGRFIQPDPTISDPESSQSLNRYSYCGNNPLNAIDPSGFDGESVGGDSFGDGGGWYPPVFWGDGNVYTTWPPTSFFASYDSSQRAVSIPPPAIFESISFGSGYGSIGSAYPEGGGGFPPPDFSGFSVIPTPHTGGGWLSMATNAAGWASILPGPVGTVAGILNAGGELLQGNYGAAAWAIGGAALATVGAGVAVKAIQMARAARAARVAETMAVDAAKVAKAVETEMALVRVGDRLTTVNDVLRNPSLLAGKGPAEIQAILGKTPGWQIEALGKGSHAGEGWVLREYTAAGNPTGKMLRWHPGGGHHGPNPYWRATGGAGGKSGIIPGGAEP